MSGNVWEWTASEFALTHDAKPASKGYTLRTIKGGGWDNLDFPAAGVRTRGPIGAGPAQPVRGLSMRPA